MQYGFPQVVPEPQEGPEYPSYLIPQVVPGLQLSLDLIFWLSGMCWVFA